LSYFAKPNFIVYDEWFDNDFKKTKLDFKNKKITNSSKIHEFFYEQSNYKIGASENNLQIEIDENREELFNNYYFESNSEKYGSLSNKNFLFLKKIAQKKLKFNIKKKMIYSLSIFGFVIILGLILFFISQSKKNESTITSKSILLEKRF
jgi:pilus assembly protein TadC